MELYKLKFSPPAIVQTHQCPVVSSVYALNYYITSNMNAKVHLIAALDIVLIESHTVLMFLLKCLLLLRWKTTELIY